jgi:tRNA 2-thiouridine synthesizing protein A
MSEMKTVDARGLSCPEPVLLTRQAIGHMTDGRVEILVDSVTSRENISRFAGSAGWQVTVEEAGGSDYRLVLSKSSVPSPPVGDP